MRLRNLFVLVAIFCLTLTVPATGQTRSGLMLFGGIGSPSGNFGKTEGDEAGFAKLGYFGGAEVMFSLAQGFGVVIDGRYMTHKLNEDELLKQMGGGSGVSVTIGSYTGILPMAGMRFYTASPIAIFVDAQAGYMFAKSPEMTYSAYGYGSKVESQNGKGLAYGASAGIDINNSLVIGASYIMTKPKFDVPSTSGIGSTTTREQQMNVIQIFGGIRF